MEGTVAEPLLAVVRLVWGVLIIWEIQVVRILLLANLQRLFRTYSISASCEYHIVVGTSLSAADKKCMVWVILYSAVTWGCVRYACKYSAVSVIISDLVFLPIAWIQRYLWSTGHILKPSRPLWYQDFRLFEEVWMIIL